MAYNNNRDGSSINEEQVAAFLADAVRRVESSSDSDIETLKAFKKLFKKNVPFSRRSYVAAMLIKNATSGFRSNRINREGKNDRFNSKREERFNRNERTAERKQSTEEHTERAPRVTIDPSVAGTIFIGVGRSRGVFPRDLVGLLVSVAGFDRSRIGEIRVLSNYSFIQLFAEDCDKAIAALNGYDYRGRKLSVSYSRKKEDGEETIPANVTNEGHADTSVNAEEAKIAAEQTAFAASMDNAPVEAPAVEEAKADPAPAAAPVEEKTYFETTDDGQVKSHFVNN